MISGCVLPDWNVAKRSREEKEFKSDKEESEQAAKEPTHHGKMMIFSIFLISCRIDQNCEVVFIFTLLSRKWLLKRACSHSTAETSIISMVSSKLPTMTIMIENWDCPESLLWNLFYQTFSHFLVLPSDPIKPAPRTKKCYIKIVLRFHIQPQVYI